jgi:hypothetical protein
LIARAESLGRKTVRFHCLPQSVPPRAYGPRSTARLEVTSKMTACQLNFMAITHYRPRTMSIGTPSIGLGPSARDNRIRCR